MNNLAEEIFTVCGVVDSAHVVEVVEVKHKRGHGRSEQDPVREVTRYFTLKGELIAEVDQYGEPKRDVATRAEMAKRISVLEEALEFYAEHRNWVTPSGKYGITPVWNDIGKRAKDVLGSEP